MSSHFLFTFRRGQNELIKDETWEDLIETIDKDFEDVHVAKFDCTVYRPICEGIGVESYPSLVWMKKGEIVNYYSVSYDGKYNVENLKTYVFEMMKQSPPPLIEREEEMSSEDDYKQSDQSGSDEKPIEADFNHDDVNKDLIKTKSGDGSVRSEHDAEEPAETQSVDDAAKSSQATDKDIHDDVNKDLIISESGDDSIRSEQDADEEPVETQKDNPSVDNAAKNSQAADEDIQIQSSFEVNDEPEEDKAQSTDAANQNQLKR